MWNLLHDAKVLCLAFMFWEFHLPEMQKMKNGSQVAKRERFGIHTVILIILVVFSSTWCTWVRWVHWHMLQLYGVYRCISTCTYDNNINACKYKIDGYPHATYRVFQDMTASQHQTGRPVSKVNLGRRPWSSWCPFLLRGFGIQIFEMASSWSKDMI